MAEQSSWNKQELQFQAKAHQRHFPTESMLRALLSSSYFENAKKIESGQKVLYIGCLYTNNLVPFWDRGCALYGVEITEDSVDIARETAAQQRMDVRVEQGLNRELPFDDDMFDFVLSVNTIHYEESKENLVAGLAEMRRVLKPGGCLFVSTGGQEHFFVSTAVKNGPNDYVVQAEDDFRAGQKFTFFEDVEDFNQTLAEIYKDVETAVITEFYPKHPLQFYIAKCFK